MNFLFVDGKKSAGFLVLGLLLGAGLAYAWSSPTLGARASAGSTPVEGQPQKTGSEDDKDEAAKRNASRMEKIQSVIAGYSSYPYSAANEAHLYAYLSTLSVDELLAIEQPQTVDDNNLRTMTMALHRLFDLAPQRAAEFARSVAPAYHPVEHLTAQQMADYINSHRNHPLNTTPDVVAIWSMYDPAGALHYVASLSAQAPEARYPYPRLFRSLAEADPAVAFQAINGLAIDPSQKKELIASVTSTWAGIDLAGCMANYQSMAKGPDRAEALRSMLDNGIQVDPKATLDLLTQNLGEIDSYAIQQTTQQVAEDDPALALDCAKLVANPQQRTALEASALQGWAQVDPESAWKYAGSQLSGDEQKNAVENITHDVAHDDPLLVSDWIGKMPDGPAKNRACTMLLFQWSVYEPGHAAKWVETLPQDKNRSDQVNRVAGHWASQDPEKAKAWVDSLPSGADRDSGNYACAWEVASQDPTGALTMAATISDPALQQRALAQVYKRAAAADNTAAQAWIQQSGLSDDDKQKILAQSAK